VFGFLRLPEAPVWSRPIDVDASTSPDQLVVRTMLAVNRLTLTATGLMVLQQTSQAAVPIVMGLAIDRAIASTDRGALVVWLAVLGGLYVSYRLAFRLEIMASLPVDDFLHLLLGNRGIDDVERTTADCLVRTDVGALMLDVLFPSMPLSTWEFC